VWKVSQHKPKEVDKLLEEKSKPKTTNAQHKTKLVRKKPVIMTCILSTLILAGTIAIFLPKLSVAQAGYVESIGTGIYWDQRCTNKTLQLNWRNIVPNSVNTLTVFIRNEGNSEVTLSLTTTDWIPRVSSDYMRLSWNYSGQSLSVGQIIPVTLTLTVDSDVIGVVDFQFDTIISAINEG
jgi:hypothetical protein